MAKNEKTSKRVGKIASKGLRAPKSLTPEEIKSLAASAVTQMPDKPKKKKKKKAKASAKPKAKAKAKAKTKTKTKKKTKAKKKKK